MAGSGGGKVALVTGAASGIGAATAAAFFARGYATALVDIDATAGRRVEARLRAAGECVFLPCDVTDDEAVRRTVDQSRPTAETSLDYWNRGGADGALRPAGGDRRPGAAALRRRRRLPDRPGHRHRRRVDRPMNARRAYAGDLP